MPQYIRRIVLLVIAIVLPMHGLAAAMASDCAMAVKADIEAHCCNETKPSAPMKSSAQSLDHKAVEKTSQDKAPTSECLAGADCHCSALYQGSIPFSLNAPLIIFASKFIAVEKHFVAIPQTPLWRPPVTV